MWKSNLSQMWERNRPSSWPVDTNMDSHFKLLSKRTFTKTPYSNMDRRFNLLFE